MPSGSCWALELALTLPACLTCPYCTTKVFKNKNNKVEKPHTKPVPSHCFRSVHSCALRGGLRGARAVSSCPSPILCSLPLFLANLRSWAAVWVIKLFKKTNSFPFVFFHLSRTSPLKPRWGLRQLGRCWHPEVLVPWGRGCAPEPGNISPILPQITYFTSEAQSCSANPQKTRLQS